MYCSDCGQKLPDNGVCYNCIKIRDDAKRFGRGSGTLPAHIKYGPHGATFKSVDPGPKRKIPKQGRPVVKSGSRNKRKRTRTKRVPHRKSVKTRAISTDRSRHSKKKTPLYLGRAAYKSKSRSISRTYIARVFPIAIVGEWLNLRTKEIVIIEGKGNRWQLRKKVSQKPPTIWGISRLTRNQIIFKGRIKTITAHVGAKGSLILKERGRQVPFAALTNGQRNRICNKCFLLSAWQADACVHCCKPFARV